MGTSELGERYGIAWNTYQDTTRRNLILKRNEFFRDILQVWNLSGMLVYHLGFIPPFIL